MGLLAYLSTNLFKISSYDFTRMKSLLIFTALFFLLSCETKNQADTDDSQSLKTIAVVNYPLYYFAKSIAGDRATVYFPAIDGDPTQWKPSARQVGNFQKADLILANGAGYESWMEKVSLPSSKIIVTSGQFKDQWIEIQEEVTHSHGPEGEHVHAGTASNTWLNFQLALKQASVVYESIVSLFPDDAKSIDDNYAILKEDLMQLDELAKSVTEDIGDRNMLDIAGFYQYFIKAYDLHDMSDHLHSIDLDKPESLHTLLDHDVAIILSDKVLSNDANGNLNGQQINICIFDPCANRPDEGDFIEVMKRNLDNLKVAARSD